VEGAGGRPKRKTPALKGRGRSEGNRPELLLALGFQLLVLEVQVVRLEVAENGGYLLYRHLGIPFALLLVAPVLVLVGEVGLMPG